jgi:hypothetical protein
MPRRDRILGAGRRRTEFAPDSGAIADQAFVLRRCRGELDGCSLPTASLAGVLLSRLPRVVSARCGLIFEGGATLNGIDILHRSILLPLSEDGVAIDHVLGAVSYHSLPTGEALIPQVISQTHWF